MRVRVRVREGREGERERGGQGDRKTGRQGDRETVCGFRVGVHEPLKVHGH